MKTRTLLLLLATVTVAQAQNEWRLEPFLEYFGHVEGTLLGNRVKGFVGSYQNNPYNVAVAEGYNPFIEAPRLLFYHIASPQDTTPRWIIPGGANLEHGDFNGDGFTDLAVWKSLKTGYNDTVLVYLGNTTGIDTIPAFKLPAEQQRSAFGSSMCVGDLNNDQIDDLVITAPTYYLDFFGQNYGKVYMYNGPLLTKTAASFTITGSCAGTGLGTKCAIGDFNDDGFNDLAIRGFDVSASFDTTVPSCQEQSFFGYLNIYFGSTQIDTVADLTSPRAGEGAALSGGLAVFDANTDGKVDLLWTYVDTISARRSVFIHYGGSDFQNRFNAAPDFVISAPPLGGGDFGNEIANAGDMNGDGDDDILISDYSTFQNNGIVFVYTAGKALDDRFDAARGQTLAGAFGASIDRIGDVNHDGYSDIIVGAPRQPFVRDQGYFGIFLGDARIPTTVQTKGDLPHPTDFLLSPAYPNPFNSEIIFEFSLSERATIELKVFDILGKEVKNLLKEEYDPGKYEIRWPGKDEKGTAVSSGIYFCRMRVFAGDGSLPDFVQAQKFTVVR
jgi:hypothetical protein